VQLKKVENASWNVPRAMWWSFILNMLMGLAMLVTMLFCIGDLNAAIDSSTPYLILFQNTGLNVWAYALMVILFFLVFLGNITALATTPREL
jgi:choline transport protein